jgi:protease-4
MSNPFALLDMFASAGERGPTGPTIALLHIDGPIVDGESKPGGLMGEASVGSLTIRKALAEIEASDLVKGVVVRINSPGGSAIASESIWQGLRRVAESRPVWVSVGSMAASGGYYIAVAGDKMYVNPSSIVGSIGVVGGKIAMGGVYDKLKIHVVERARGPRASIMSSVAPWNDEQRALVRSRMQETYDLFTKRVATGRPGIDLAATAEGRLFDGRRAIDLKMADQIGGVEDAIRELAVAVGLPEGAYDVLDYPAPPTLTEVLSDAMERFGMGASAPGVGLDAIAAGVRDVVGPRAWPSLRDAAAALLQLRKEPVILASPRVLLFR